MQIYKKNDYCYTINNLKNAIKRKVLHYTIDSVNLITYCLIQNNIWQNTLPINHGLDQIQINNSTTEHQREIIRIYCTAHSHKFSCTHFLRTPSQRTYNVQKTIPMPPKNRIITPNYESRITPEQLSHIQHSQFKFENYRSTIGTPMLTSN